MSHIKMAGKILILFAAGMFVLGLVAKFAPSFDLRPWVLDPATKAGLT